MSGPAQFPTEAQAKHAERTMLLLTKAQAYVARLSADPKELRATTEQAWLDLCEAGCDLWDDGDAMAAANIARDEMGIDAEGYPLDAPRSFNPSMVHPDNPSQAAGWTR